MRKFGFAKSPGSMLRNLPILVPVIIIAIGLLVILDVYLFILRPAALPPGASISPTFKLLPTNGATSEPPAVSELQPTPQPTLQATLILPATPSLTPEQHLTPQPVSISYTVQAGDSLSGIASIYGVTVLEIKTWNNLQGDVIYPGQVLLVYQSLFANSVKTPTVTSQPPQDTQPAQTENTHIVLTGETLAGIAVQYGLSEADLRAANAMVGDAVLPDQRLTIPKEPVQTTLPWKFSILEGNLDAAYPLSSEQARFTLHFTPGTYPAQDPAAIANLVQRGLDQIESVMQATLNGRFNIYAAGSLFNPPDQMLRGRSFSVQRRSFFLHDGTGNATDQQYIVTHELTHLFSWNVFGQPVSTMLSEGAAVYSGMSSIVNSPYIPLVQFCAAYLKAGVLPVVSGSLSFQGHILDLQNYYAAGCFVGYLIETYSPQSFGMVYPTGNFESAYGSSLYNLEENWRAFLRTQESLLTLDPARLVAEVQSVENTYSSFFPGFKGAPHQIDAYRILDYARLALLEGRFDEVDLYIIQFESANK